MLSGLLETVTDLTQATWDVMKSPCYFLKGYFDYVVQTYQTASSYSIWWVRAGSLVFMALAAYIVRYFSGFDIFRAWCQYVTCEPASNILLLAAVYLVPILLMDDGVHEWATRWWRWVNCYGVKGHPECGDMVQLSTESDGDKLNVYPECDDMDQLSSRPATPRKRRRRSRSGQ
jgi:hypothetical protein